MWCSINFIYCHDLGVCDYRRGMDYEWQVMTAVSLMSTLKLFQPAEPSLAVPWQRLLTVEIVSFTRSGHIFTASRAELNSQLSVAWSHTWNKSYCSRPYGSRTALRNRWLSQSQSHIVTDGQSVCLSWCQAPSGANDQIFVTVWQLRSCPWEGALSDERTGLSFVSQSAVLGQLSVCTIFTFYMCHMLLNTYTIYTRPLSVRAQYIRLCPISGSFPITAV
jgi:hypothetical protein